MRIGFTTGSCSAAAAKAAAYMLLSGKEKHEISIQTPKGLEYTPEILDIKRSEREVSCAVRKDGGDDPDETTGALIYATVCFLEDVEMLPSSVSEKQKVGSRIILEGGEGVGCVTKPGLDQPVGNAAINSVPRQMILEEVQEVMDMLDYTGMLRVVISVPEGKAIAEKTFNPRLGIVGGISILGTSGVVEPMSKQALLDTIQVELNQKKALGMENIVIAPGNYGLDFMRETYGFDLNLAVKCSNFLGTTLDQIGTLGFQKVLLCGHIGKLIKVSGGIMNMHSQEADCRIELMISAGLRCGMSLESLQEMQECISTDAAYEIVKREGVETEFMSIVMEKIQDYLKKRAAGRFEIECIVFSNEYGLMGKTDGAEDLIYEIKQFG
ncbi:MAG: cobalt-precorrin-5B (C(1))-methyltransferase CbiD [Lachnospiraceae bacterium]|nr:cobalt-precorrin-5B (C(1))-methyltransferase CbiD [Lachnospiraceae bacterium]